MFGQRFRGHYENGTASEFKQLCASLQARFGDGVGIADHALGLEKLEEVAASRLIGRGSMGGTGAAEEITVGAGLVMNDTTLIATASTVKPFLWWDARENELPAGVNVATLDFRNGHPVLDFDGSVDEEAVFGGVLPTHYGGGGVRCELWIAFTSAVSGFVRFQAAIERMNVASLTLDADDFAAFQSAGGTAPGLSGQLVIVAIPFTNGAQMDSLQAGEAFRLKVRRDADGTSGTDNIPTDAELLRVVLRES